MLIDMALRTDNEPTEIKVWHVNDCSLGVHEKLLVDSSTPLKFYK